LGLDASKKTILILGGSQGSLELNKVLANCLAKNPSLQSKINIIHQTGALDTNDWAQSYKTMGIDYIVFDYKHDLSLYYQTADIIIGRAGAGTIFESLFFEKPCILVPLEIVGNNHQLHNAQAIAQEHPEPFTVIRKNEMESLGKILEKLLEA
jgi:UDP-N-acetylglucosamine--N-acetylmuramyl-(pentapeptide) pyrophosphoryl-undecaprenol N-acetylglucosamine transferase